MSIAAAVVLVFCPCPVDRAGGQDIAAPAAPALHSRTAPRPAVQAAAAPRRSVACSSPAPATVAGYRALWARVPVVQWGAADVSLSVALPGGRIAWLYGDTLRAGPMAHSSLIVQERGCLHVSNGGAQLLPDDDAQHIYWIEAAERAPGGLVVTARAIVLTGGHGAWDFRDAGYSRTARVALDAAGDGRFVRWTGGPIVRPQLPSSPLHLVGPHHFTYAVHAHPEAVLVDGRLLVTTCQNWDDGTLHPFADYRPIVSEVAR